MLSKTPVVRIYAQAELPTRLAELTAVSFIDTLGHRLDDVAIIRGQVAGIEDVPTRVHSECLTGDVFGSLRCDCRDQLEIALDTLSSSSCGIVLYMRQEGRGIGIAEKIRAYQLQQEGLDTVEANEHLGFDGDLRTYERAAAMLHALEVESILLMTNNPRKIEGLREHGVVVSGRAAIVAASNSKNEEYLATKSRKMGHLY